MNKQTTKNLSRVPVSTSTKSATENETTEKNKTLGKRKKPEPEGNPDASDDLCPVVMGEARKKIQKVSHSNTIDHEESVAKMKSEIILELSFVQTNLACACGHEHTITLSDDGTAHSFGKNKKGALGLGHNNNVSLPTPIPNLPKINMISCGMHFTVCVDDEGFIWSFGENNYGQLGTGNTTNFNVPQKLLDIPPVLSVSCGYNHTLIITNDDDLWSCGKNNFGQLCHEYKEVAQSLKKHHFQAFLNYQLVLIIHYFKTTKEKYLHVGVISGDNVDWVILMILKLHQVSFSIYLPTLFILFVEITIAYFLIQKEMYFRLGIIILVN